MAKNSSAAEKLAAQKAAEEKERREAAVGEEESRLKKLYAKIGKNKRATIEGLIQRAAFMRISLAELEADINKNGLTESFAQGDQIPYVRTRPAAVLYNTMNTGYQKIIKQLTDLLPEETASREKDDGFDGFVGGRDD